MAAKEFNFDTAKQFIGNNRKAPLLVIGLFALLIILFIFNTVSRLHTPAATNNLPVLKAPAATTYSPDIATFHLFGEYQDNTNLLPETTLQLTLEGIALAVNPGDTSRAIISSNGSSKIYSVGQTVPGGATIRAINRTQVILDQNHQLTSLKLPIPKLEMKDGVYQSTNPS